MAATAGAGGMVQSTSTRISAGRNLFRNTVHPGMPCHGRPGGHLLVGDHSGVLGLYAHLRLMEEQGKSGPGAAPQPFVTRVLIARSRTLPPPPLTTPTVVQSLSSPPSQIKSNSLMWLAGFEEMDCAWRERDFFVVGARKPL